MKITRTSLLSGTTRTIDLPVTEEQLVNWHIHGMHIQDAMPKLTSDQREFLMTGITKEEWDAEFGDESDVEELE